MQPRLLVIILTRKYYVNSSLNSMGLVRVLSHTFASRQMYLSSTQYTFRR